MAKAKPKPVYIYIKSVETDEVIEKVLVRRSNLTKRMIERCTSGMTRNMDLERFYVDDDEAQAAAEQRRSESE
jgi:hypothetical protein